MNQEQWRQLTPAQQHEHATRYGPPPPAWNANTLPQYATGYDLGTAQDAAPQVVVVERKRRRIWPWVLLAVVMIPILVVVSCSVLFVGAAKSIDDARKGGTVPIGQTFTYADGVSLTVSPITPYQPTNNFEVDDGEVAYQGEVTVVNGSHNPINTVTVSTNVSIAGVAATPIYDGQAPADQDLAAGQTAKITFKFKVKKGTKGASQVSVAAEFNEPVFFTGTLG